MVLNLKRWIEFIEDEELVLVIGGNEYFFEYDKKEYNKLVNYFNNISNFRFN